MKRDIPNPYPRGACFFCGENNPQGLRLRFHLDDKAQEVCCEYTPEPRFAGQGDILHGAIQMGLLDETMGWACTVLAQSMGVTTALDVRFHRPAYISAGTLGVACRVLGRKGRDLRLEARLTASDGTLCTTATGVYRLLSPERYAALIRS